MTSTTPVARLSVLGEALLANTAATREMCIRDSLYRMERGAARLTAQNYYDENGAELDIPLDPLLTPQQNAAKYYKRYTKAKTAEKHLREQIDKAIGEREMCIRDSL